LGFAQTTIRVITGPKRCLSGISGKISENIAKHKLGPEKLRKNQKYRDKSKIFATLLLNHKIIGTKVFTIFEVIKENKVLNDMIDMK
jgi:hypothetical protein